MFSKLGNLAAMAKQAVEMQGKMAEMQEALKRLKVEGSAGAGMVKVEVSGHLQVLSCRISPELVRENDPEMLEDLILAAVNQGLEKAREATAQEMAKITGGLDIAGLQQAMSQFGLGK